MNKCDKLSLALEKKLWLSAALCCALGAIGPLGFSPFNFWPVSLGAIALFIFILNSVNTSKHFFFLAFAFALGYYGTGVSWVYISIHQFGSAPVPLAVLMTALFVAFVALVFALPFYTLTWFKPKLRALIGIPLIWVLSEWIRTWFLTCIRDRLTGYSHIDTALFGWAPIGGVLLISLWSLLSSSVITSLFYRHYSAQQKALLVSLVSAIWLGGYALQGVQWTQSVDEKISVGLVQPNIPQDLRWAPEYQDIIKERLHSLSEPLWTNDWIIWPEAAVPNVYHASLDFLEETKTLARKHNSTVVTGVLYDEPRDSNQQRQKYFNSIIGIGDSEGIYHKQRLVPFGEYVPLEALIRGLIEFFDLPFSVISSGQSGQNNLRLGAYELANAICYEIAYPALVATQAKQAHVLLTVSNDAWFGDSIGPLQHFQMVRMRAAEIGRYIIRGTNNGVSAIIQPDGNILVDSEQFIMTHLSGHVIPMEGTTPYMWWKNYLVLSLLIMMFMMNFTVKNKLD